ncbi:MAG TPA: DNA primase [Pyrinomonadaceae bacterium]|nr:DNA primase [Pyrinomonadaceae bacterium]
MRYPQTFIDDLRRQADIVRVIQDYVQLKKKGANWMACCPFHKEKTPSFSVSPTKDIFYCFGCHKGGSVFNFVMEIERVGFPEAIKIVADKVGMPLPKMVDDGRFESKRQEADDVIQMNTWAMQWWEQQLESTAEARIARDYLVGREISSETQNNFRLGYSPDSWDALSLHLRQKGATQAQIDRSGLVVLKDSGGSYDRFRGRLMFPILDIQGRPIAFGGRTLRNEDAKYINSPETAAYVKGRNLYGLNLTRDEIRRQEFAILVEGFLDLIVPYQAGVKNIVASLGTALTPDQVKLLSRFAHKVVVNYDGDRAGVQAAKKSIEILLAEDLEVKVLVLPDDSDPDEFIRKFGVTEYQRRRAKALPHIQFVIDHALRDRSLHRPAEKAEAVEEVLPYIRAVRNRVQKREYFDMAMDALRINDVTLRRELWQTLRTAVGDSADVSDRVLKRSQVKATVAETKLLELLLSDEQMRRDFLPRLAPSDYEELATAGIFEALFQLQMTGGKPDFETLSEKVQDDQQARELLPMLLMHDAGDVTDEEADQRVAANRYVEALHLMSIERRIKQIVLEITAADNSGDASLRDQLVLEQLNLDRRRKALMPSPDAPVNT